MMASLSPKMNNFDDIVNQLKYSWIDPHSVLGLHPAGDHQILRIWRPEASELFIRLQNNIERANQVHPEGLFEINVPNEITYKDYQIWHANGLQSYDPYTFWPVIGELDQYLFAKGTHYTLWNILGARLMEHQGVQGVKFAVWAPNAKRISLVGDFNHWDGRTNPMRSLGSSGIWELFIPGLREGEKYKFEIHDAQNKVHLKADPYGFWSELRPKTASKVFDVYSFAWSDGDFIQQRIAKQQAAKPLNIYELHLGSWKKNGNDFLNYREIALLLAAYCKDMGYTHVELMPIQEHPLDESWGYQVTGYFATTRRYGSPLDFQWFVNHLHSHDIGVILDWVPGHFPTDSFALSRFDGTALYEHEDMRLGFHPHWNTYIFNFGRHEVTNFLIANALFWIEVMHIDGLRVDAVASMLYLDYGRESDNYIPNRYGGKENLEAIEFIKHLNSIVHRSHPGILMIAEESTSFTGVTHSVDQGGLGFDFKWNMGWMNDTLRYFSKDMLYRNYHHNDLTFGLLYAFSERFILVLSHDEVVHGKKSLMGKMPGDVWQQFANMRLLYSYMICQPGKKLTFMGTEIATWNEWSVKRSVEWDLLKYPSHDSIKRLVHDINHLYLNYDALWQKDDHFSGFEWVSFSDTDNSIICYLRKSDTQTLLCIHSFTPVYFPCYYIPLANIKQAKEVFNSDNAIYGGANNLNPHPHIVCNEMGNAVGLNIAMPPLATMIFHVEYQ